MVRVTVIHGGHVYRAETPALIGGCPRLTRDGAPLDWPALWRETGSGPTSPGMRLNHMIGAEQVGHLKAAGRWHWHENRVLGPSEPDQEARA